jgi:hypothetical protein
MKRSFFFAALYMIVLAGCGSESDTKSTTDSTTVDSTFITPAPDTTTNGLPPVVRDSSKTSSVDPQVPAAVPAAATTSNITLNPEHGKPGHRCDIAVGAPLNAASNNVSATPSTPTKNNDVVRLNPAHGQPGHDCAVEVGKPLKN